MLVGLSGGWVDKLVMRFVDVVLSLPFLPLVIVLGVYFGASIQTQVIVIAFVMWAGLSELRAQIFAIRARASSRRPMPWRQPVVRRPAARAARAGAADRAAVRACRPRRDPGRDLAQLPRLGDLLQNSWGAILFHANARTAFLPVPGPGRAPGLFMSLTVLALAFIGFGYDGSLAPRIAGRGTRRRAPAGPRAGAALTARAERVSYDTEFGTQPAVQDVDLTRQRANCSARWRKSGSARPRRRWRCG